MQGHRYLPDLQERYLADPKSGACPFYEVGQEFVFERYGTRDDFWTVGHGSQCAEAWDCIARYVYTALQGGSIMRNWTNDERMMIACCNDGTRPVVFKIERIDYQVLYLEGVDVADGASPELEERVARALRGVSGVQGVVFNREQGFVEVVVEREISSADLAAALGACDGLALARVE